MVAKFIPKNIPRNAEFRFGEIPLNQYLKKHAQRVPYKTFINFYGREISYKEMDDSIDKLATYLTKIGVRRGDSIVLFMQNCPQFVMAFYAIQRIGAVVVPCSPMFKEWDLEYDVKEVNAKVIISNKYLYPICNAVKEKTSIETIIIAPISDYLLDEPKPYYDFNPEQPDNIEAIFLKDILADTDAHVSNVSIDMKKDVSCIIFTSGSTGMPKGAMLSNMNALYKACSTSINYYTTEYDIYLGSMPLNHIAGMTMMHMNTYNGSTMVLVHTTTPEIVMQTTDMYKCNRCYISALTMTQIMAHPDLNKYNMCYMRSGQTTSWGVQYSEEIAKQWSEMTKGGLVLEVAYGLTEGHTMDCVMPVEKPKFGTCGVPVLSEMEIRIVDDEGNEVPSETIGEVTVRSPGVFMGYLNNPEGTANALRDGWLFTGDIGKVDEEGYLTFLGRKKEMIKTSGFSVFPEEVETYLGKHEAVSSSIVIGKLDNKKGELIKAFVVLNDEYKGKITEDEMLEWCKDKMATYKRPREIEFRDALPTTATGKLLRRILREEEEKKSN